MTKLTRLKRGFLYGQTKQSRNFIVVDFEMLDNFLSRLFYLTQVCPAMFVRCVCFIKVCWSLLSIGRQFFRPSGQFLPVLSAIGWQLLHKLRVLANSNFVTKKESFGVWLKTKGLNFDNSCFISILAVPRSILSPRSRRAAPFAIWSTLQGPEKSLSLIHIWRCRRS